MGKPDDYVFQANGISAEAVVNSNPAFDLDKDGILTMAEYKQYLNNKLPPELLNSKLELDTPEIIVRQAKLNAIPLIISALVIIIIGGYFIWRAEKK